MIVEFPIIIQVISKFPKLGLDKIADWNVKMDQMMTAKEFKVETNTSFTPCFGHFRFLLRVKLDEIFITSLKNIG